MPSAGDMNWSSQEKGVAWGALVLKILQGQMTEPGDYGVKPLQARAKLSRALLVP